MRFVDLLLCLDSTTALASPLLDRAVACAVGLRARLTILDLCDLDEIGIASSPRSEAFAVDVRTALRIAKLDGGLVAAGPFEPMWRPHLDAADLVILSSAPDAFPASRDVPASALRTSTTPLLFLPSSDVDAPVGKRVLVPWISDRASAQAIRDALPVLAVADEVILVSPDPDGRGGDTARRLGRHGIRVKVEAAAHQSDIAAQAERWGADLVVLGAAGPPRWPTAVLPAHVRSLIERRSAAVFLSP